MPSIFTTLLNSMFRGEIDPEIGSHNVRRAFKDSIGTVPGFLITCSQIFVTLHGTFQ